MLAGFYLSFLIKLEDDHIISSNDLHYLQAIQHEQTKRQPNVPKETQLSHRTVGSSATSPSAYSTARGNKLSRTPEQKRLRNKGYRIRLQEQKEKDPAGYRAFRQRRNENERARKAMVPLQVQKERNQKRYKVYKKKLDKIAETAKGAKMIQERNKKHHLDYKAKLGQKILNNQATEGQIALYKKAFGRLNYENLFKKDQPDKLISQD